MNYAIVETWGQIITGGYWKGEGREREEVWSPVRVNLYKGKKQLC